MVKKTTTKNQNIEQTKKTNDLFGWLIALCVPICMVLTLIIGHRLPADILSIVLCQQDRNNLKKQDVWQKQQIAWGWIFIPPVYMYKRAKLLHDNMVKFWICTILWGLMIISVGLMIFNVVLMSGCINDAMSIYGIGRSTASSLCECVVDHSEMFCLSQLGLL